MTTVLIAGMHRSGTSMTTRLLNLCGLYLGLQNDLQAGDANNPEGYWEHREFLGVNEELLKALGASWAHPPHLSAGWETSDVLASVRSRASNLLEQFAGEALWGWKDPRNSITLPFWQQFLPSMKVVICVRNPRDVAQSLFKRDAFSAGMAFDLWLAYNQSVLASTERENRIITHYDSYFEDPYAELKRILLFLDMHTPDQQILEAINTLSIPLRHS